MVHLHSVQFNVLIIAGRGNITILLYIVIVSGHNISYRGDLQYRVPEKWVFSLCEFRQWLNTIDVTIILKAPAVQRLSNLAQKINSYTSIATCCDYIKYYNILSHDILDFLISPTPRA